ncbi:lamin tail domain-containing protein [Psychromonas sp. KJ10-2]|uniref:lamin tail domain-containing protein n=1 Tax=Psychromonas sp. KJ10-2 TaxID=3391822 RepID=UPI0039B63696
MMSNILKKTTLSLVISGILAANANAAITDIIISEYVEGSGDNKAIELTNTGSSSYTFPSNIELQYSSYDNQIRTPDGDNILEGLTIAGGATVVIYNSAADAALSESIASSATAVIAASYDEQSYYSLSFNGDDHVAIIDTDTNTTYDTIGTDGTYWGSGQTLRRRAGEGDSTPVQSSTYSSSDWEDFGEDVFDDLGTATYSEYEEVVASTCSLDTQTTIAEIQGSDSASPLLAAVLSLLKVIM